MKPGLPPGLAVFAMLLAGLTCVFGPFLLELAWHALTGGGGSW